MRNFLERYEVKLRTIGPVHISSGESLRKDQWIRNERNGTATMIDFPKFVEFLSKKNLLESYEKSLMGKNKVPLFAWLRDNGINQHDILEFTSYTLDIRGLNLKNGQIKDMQLAIKDPFGLPYIPGSSLKGAIRNVLMAKRLKESRLTSQKIVDEIEHFTGNRRMFLEREKKRLNADVFHTLERSDNKSDAVNDVMRGVRISDSNSVELSSLTLCQKIDVGVKGKETELPIIRECIKPDTEFYFDLTIDRTETDVTIEEIKLAIDQFLNDYNNMFLEAFREETIYQSQVIYLGGGVGFPSKTVLNQILENEPDRVKLVGKTIDQTLGKGMKRHSRDFTKGVSPVVVKLTEIDRELFQMGPCSIEFSRV